MAESELVSDLFVEDCKADIFVDGIEVSIEEFPAVGHVPVDTFVAVEEGAIGDGRDVGKYVPAHVGACGVVP